MLRRSLQTTSVRPAALIAGAGAAASSSALIPLAASPNSSNRGYKYQNFEMSKDAQYIFYYPRETPNTSYFGQWFLGTFTWFGWGREDVWIDNAERRYMTTWQRWRQYAMWFFPLFYVGPGGLWGMYLKQSYGEYGWKSFLNEKMPLDQLYIENGWQSVDAEYIRHIHSRDSY